MVWRRVLVLGSCTLRELHGAIQGRASERYGVLMGWTPPDGIVCQSGGVDDTT